jgi:hypothetical protein
MWRWHIVFVLRYLTQIMTVKCYSEVGFKYCSCQFWKITKIFGLDQGNLLRGYNKIVRRFRISICLLICSLLINTQFITQQKSVDGLVGLAIRPIGHALLVQPSKSPQLKWKIIFVLGSYESLEDLNDWIRSG